MRTFQVLKSTSVTLAAALMFVCPIVASAQARTTPGTATEYFDPMNLLGGGAVGTLLDPGTVTCPGALPTGNPAQPCPPESRVQIRGFSGRSRMISDDPLLSGWLRWRLNANFDATAAGRAWGTFELELDAGGVWEGSWIDQRTKVDGVNVWVGRARWTGRGTGGSVIGMHLHFTEVGVTYMSMPIAWVVPVDAKIVVAPRR